MELGPNKPLKCYWWHYSPNFGDTISKPLLEHFTGKSVVLAGGGDRNKIMAAGSIIETARSGDIIWGSGHNRNTGLRLPLDIKILAVRGPITRSLIIEPEAPEVYGDPAILLPRLYNPVVEKQYSIGLIPHYIDKKLIQPGHTIRFRNKEEKGHIIDVQDDWKKVVREIKKCDLIISSSLHGIIAAEVYDVPVVWAIWGNKIVGDELKYQDYFLGTERQEQKPFTILPKIKNLDEKQDRLLAALHTVF